MAGKPMFGHLRFCGQSIAVPRYVLSNVDEDILLYTEYFMTMRVDFNINLNIPYM